VSNSFVLKCNLKQNTKFHLVLFLADFFIVVPDPVAQHPIPSLSSVKGQFVQVSILSLSLFVNPVQDGQQVRGARMQERLCIGSGDLQLVIPSIPKRSRLKVEVEASRPKKQLGTNSVFIHVQPTLSRFR
jgi:hypothetical protein